MGLIPSCTGMEVLLIRLSKTRPPCTPARSTRLSPCIATFSSSDPSKWSPDGQTDAPNGVHPDGCSRFQARKLVRTGALSWHHWHPKLCSGWLILVIKWASIPYGILDEPIRWSACRSGGYPRSKMGQIEIAMMTRRFAPASI
jgi:hypothetical protein